MIQTYDVGSLPFPDSSIESSYKTTASRYNNLLHYLIGSEYMKVFERTVVKGFLDKSDKAAIDVPNYPQFRDMNEMFLENIRGVEKTKSGYNITGKISVDENKLRIPEVSVLNENSRRIYETVGEQLELKLCVTGPYTLLSLFPHGDLYLLQSLGSILSDIVKENVFENNWMKVEAVAIDEPSFGIDDSRIGYGTVGRENLRKAWEEILYPARDITTIIHLHNTSDRLPWETDRLKVIESHVDDNLYKSDWTKKRLEETDKFLRASICVTVFDELIRREVSRKGLDEYSINARIGEIWAEIRQEKIDPVVFLEDVETMRKRLKKVVNTFGEERVPYAGPECGLGGFPSYECAIEYLRRVSEATRSFNLNS